MFTRPFHTSYRAASQRSWQRMNQFRRQLLRSLFDALQKIRVESCPFENLPATGRNRWDQGLTAAEMRRCRWVKPAMVCQVRYTEWTRDDRLRHPVFLGIREAKSPTDVVGEKAS
jgi:bifunctional non-homologous end joining protein LigD